MRFPHFSDKPDKTIENYDVLQQIKTTLDKLSDAFATEHFAADKSLCSSTVVIFRQHGENYKHLQHL
jgi:hypothetical protein